MRRTKREEKGLALVIVALVMVTLMVFAAFVVDLGQLYVERRNDQNSADAAAMSSLVRLLQSGSTQTSVTEAVDKVTADLGRTVSAAEWSACTDSNALTHTAAELSLTPATACISFSSSFGRLRVRVPDQTIATTFGRVVGINEFTSSAFAEAGIEPVGGGTLPFVVLSVNGPGDQVCLRTDGTGGAEPPPTGTQLDPCDAGNFDVGGGGRGTLLPELYEQGCSSPGNQSIIDAIMVGVDHPLGIHDPAAGPWAPNSSANAQGSALATRRVDGDNGCTVALPNTVDVDDGLTAQLLRCALLERPCDAGSAATDGLNGRLSATGSARFADRGVNDTPLWDYFVSSLPAGAPASCAVAKAPGLFYVRREALIDCLSSWNSSDGVLFTEDVGDDPRFGYVPQVAERGMCDNQPQPNSTCVPSDGDLQYAHINSFAPIYIDGLYQYENNMPPCDPTNPATLPPYTGWAIHYPGADYDCGNANGNADVVHRVSGIVLPCGALPVTVCNPETNPPFPDPLSVNRLRLVK